MDPEQSSELIDPPVPDSGGPPRMPDRVRRFLGQTLLVALFSLTGAGAALAAPPRLPPLVQPASQEHLIGKVIFHELVIPDLAAAERFYAGLFGWTFRESRYDGHAHAAAFLDGRLVAVLFQRTLPARQHRQPGWLTCIAAENVDATTRSALQDGAKVLYEPRTIPDLGREAVVADPDGAVFAVLASSSGDPPDFMAAPGEWIWSSLITSDPAADSEFYRKLFGYSVVPLPAGEHGGQHFLLATENYARASVNSLPAARPDAHPSWLGFVRVEDAAATAAKATELGGRVLVAPRTDRHGGKIAVVADPAGAAVGLLEWPATTGKEATQ